ncbi:MAG: sigma-70 family RNA polymerase sigma factor [Thermoleophilia bacterium]|nr:sigma-70 family RNA polymerase sigma factor [Thermoleophilia bacterium]
MAPVPDDVIPEQLDRAAVAPPPSAESDAELLRAIGEGSEPAFEELRHRYRRAIERACRQIVGGDLEDCAQEVFVRIWRKASLYDRGRGSAPAWLLTLARRTALNVRPRRGLPLPDELADETSVVEPPDVDRFWVEAALERLPERERRVLELAYFHDLSQSAIAAELRVPLGSVKSWTRRGLHRLATILDEERA